MCLLAIHMSLRNVYLGTTCALLHLVLFTWCGIFKVTCITLLHFFTAQQHPVVGMYYSLCIHPSIDGQVGCFHFFTVAEMNAVALDQFTF